MRAVVAIPEAIWEGSFTIFGKTIRCYVLDDGRRILDADDAGALFTADGTTDVSAPGDLEKMMRWAAGKTN